VLSSRPVLPTTEFAVDRDGVVDAEPERPIGTTQLIAIGYALQHAIFQGPAPVINSFTILRFLGELRRMRRQLGFA
jgi:hypothetical protein